MEIRKAEPRDLPSCVDLSQIKEFKIEGKPLPDKIYLGEALESGIFLVAEEDNKILGFILAFKLTKSNAYLDLLTVSTETRGKGIGKKLILTLKDELNEQGIKDYFLIASTSNEKTLNFYRKNNLTECKNYTVFSDSIKK